MICCLCTVVAVEYAQNGVSFGIVQAGDAESESGKSKEGFGVFTVFHQGFFEANSDGVVVVPIANPCGEHFLFW